MVLKRGDSQILIYCCLLKMVESSNMGGNSPVFKTAGHQGNVCQEIADAR
jgi:hypothetical protein